MLLPLFPQAIQMIIIGIMFMPSILAGIVGAQFALGTKLTNNKNRKILYGSLPALIYILFTPYETIFLVLGMYVIGFVATYLGSKI